MQAHVHTVRMHGWELCMCVLGGATNLTSNQDSTACLSTMSPPSIKRVHIHTVYSITYMHTHKGQGISHTHTHWTSPTSPPSGCRAHHCPKTIPYVTAHTKGRWWECIHVCDGGHLKAQQTGQHGSDTHTYKHHDQAGSKSDGKQTQ